MLFFACGKHATGRRHAGARCVSAGASISDELRCCRGAPTSIGQRVAAAGVAVVLAGRALDLHDKNVIVAHWQRAVTFVGHSSRRVQRAVLISFVCRLCWHAAGLSFAVLSCNLRCSCDGRWQRYFPTALRWPDNGRHTCARSPYLTLPYGSRVLLRGDFGPSRCVCVSDSSDLELILSAPSVGTVGRVVWTARDLGQERPGGRRKVSLRSEAKRYANKEIHAAVGSVASRG